MWTASPVLTTLLRFLPHVTNLQCWMLRFLHLLVSSPPSACSSRKLRIQAQNMTKSIWNLHLYSNAFKSLALKLLNLCFIPASLCVSIKVFLCFLLFFLFPQQTAVQLFISYIPVLILDHDHNFITNLSTI